jgi:uncharacterized protein YxjI
MNIQFSDGHSAIINARKRVTIINGKEIPFHPKMSGNSMTTINGKSYIDGFELINGEWKRTLKALWYRLV